MESFLPNPWLLSYNSVANLDEENLPVLPSELVTLFNLHTLKFPSDFKLLSRKQPLLHMYVAWRPNAVVRLKVCSYSSIILDEGTDDSDLSVMRCSLNLPGQLIRAITGARFEGDSGSRRPRHRSFKPFLTVNRYHWGTMWQLIELEMPMENKIAFLMGPTGRVSQPHLYKFPNKAALENGWIFPDLLASFVDEVDQPWSELSSDSLEVINKIWSSSSGISSASVEEEEDWDAEIEAIRIRKESENCHFTLS